MTGLWLRSLGARFDGVALRPYAWPTPDAGDWPALRAWCLADFSQPFALAQSAPGQRALARAAALALQLDGSQALHACSGAAQRLLLRSRVKWQDALPGRAVQAGDIWDSGWVPDEPTAWTALLRFQPRRPTFIVMNGLPHEAVQQSLTRMQRASVTYRKPVRVLVLGAAPELNPPPTSIAD